MIGAGLVRNFTQQISAVKAAVLATMAAANGSTQVGDGATTVADRLAAINLADYAALRAYAGANHTAYPTGYLGAAAPAGIAGLFTRDDTDAASADNGGTIIVAANGKRWKRAYAAEVRADWFKAASDDATVQAAINAMKPTSGSVPAGGTILRLSGRLYTFNAQVNTCSGVVIEGEGAATVVTNGAGLAAGALFALASIDGSNQYRFAGIKRICLQPTGNVWAVQGTAANVLNSVLEDITLNGPYGIDLSSNSYLQGCTVQRILSLGAAEQILKLTGNFNHVHQIDKEGGSGATALPYVHIYCAANAGTANGNLLSKILVEGTGSANKVALRIENANRATLLDFWRETSANNGHCVEIVASSVYVMGTVMIGGTAGGLLSITGGSYVSMETFDASADDVDWGNYFSVDATSSLCIENLVVRRGADQIPVGASHNIKFARIVNTTQQGASTTAGFAVTQSTERRAGHNLLMNPSFEAGDYGWNFSTQPTLKEFVASDVGPGLMLHATGAGFQFTQSINIPAGWVGMPMTLRFIGKCDGGFVVPIIDGASGLAINRVSAGAGYQHIVATFTLNASGAQNFGVWWAGAAAGNNIWLDEFTLGLGTDVNLNPAKLQSFELNGCTWTTGTGAPATGTWKRGDRIVNSAPAVGSPKAWTCTAAGAPGTWVSEGNL